MEDVSGGEGDDPEADDDAANRDDPLAGRAVMDAETGGFVRAENLATEADDHEQNAESKGEPCHGKLFTGFDARLGRENFGRI